MNMKKKSMDEIPKTTTNSLRDVIDWLKKGDYVIIHNNYKHGRFFHSKCPQGTDKDHRIIYVDVSKMPGLLDDGEWDFNIIDSGNVECTCCLKDKYSKYPKKGPGTFHMVL